MNLLNKTSNHIKNVLHGFFISLGTAIAEPATVLPLIIHHFTSSSITIGLFAALLRGGAIFVQLFTAFYAQGYAYVLTYLRVVFLMRFISWFSIGVVILVIGDTNPLLTLWLMGIFLFLFSFSAGFGVIYFRELVGKIFTHEYRGFSMAYRQFFSALGAIISGFATAYVLAHFEAPQNYAYLFMVSAFIIGLGFLAFGTIEEPPKTNVRQKEKKFSHFLKNAFHILQSDAQLKLQILAQLLAYAYLISLPFYILEVKELYTITATQIGYFISVQMLGAMVSNLLWARFSKQGKNKRIILFAIGFHMLALLIALFHPLLEWYYFIFFVIGIAMDGVRLGFQNQLLIIAPEQTRPIYVALQANLTSVGLFFSILGGVVLQFSSYHVLYLLTFTLLIFSFISSLYLKDTQN